MASDAGRVCDLDNGKVYRLRGLVRLAPYPMGSMTTEPQPRKHTTHFDDCGCLTQKYEAKIKKLLAIAEGRHDCRYHRDPTRCVECAAVMRFKHMDILK